MKATAKKAETVMYVGPNIAGITINGTLYKDGKLPSLLRKKITELPVLKSLLIPVSNLAQATKELHDPKSAISICYKNALLSVKTEKEG